MKTFLWLKVSLLSLLYQSVIISSSSLSSSDSSSYQWNSPSSSLNDEYSSDDDLPEYSSSISVERRQSEQLPPYSQEREPSCAELRAIWRHMRRMARHSEITNEIPQFPGNSFRPEEFYGYMVKNPSWGSTSSNGLYKPKDKYFRNRQHTSIVPNFGQIMHQPNRRPPPKTTQKSTKNHQPLEGFSTFEDTSEPKTSSATKNTFGTFSGIPMSEDTLGIFGTVVRSPEEKALVQKEHSRPQEFGSTDKWAGSGGKNTDFVPRFGSFASNDDENGGSKTGNAYNFGSVVQSPSGFSEMDRNRPNVRFSEEDLINSAQSGRFGASQPGRSSSKNRGQCQRIEGKSCKRDDHCFCMGSKLQCIAGRCRAESNPKKVLSDEWGFWHSGPLDSSQLGISRPKRKVRTISM